MGQAEPARKFFWLIKDHNSHLQLSLTVGLYLLIINAIIRLSDTEFSWSVVGLLLGLRVFFWIIESVGSALCWRLFDRKIAVENVLNFLREHEFPKKEYSDDNLGDYLSRIQDNQYPIILRRTAGAVEGTLAICEQFGVWVGYRIRSIWETALQVYTPRSEATKHL